MQQHKQTTRYVLIVKSKLIDAT